MPIGQTHCVYVANLSYLGAVSAVVWRDMCSTISVLLASNAERSCALVMMPNVCSKGAGLSTAESVKETVRAVETLLEDTTYNLAVRYFVLQFNENDRCSDKRALAAHGAMIIRNTCRMHQRRHVVASQDWDPVSVFRHSRLWATQAVPGLVPVHPRSRFVNPASAVALELGGINVNRLSDAAEYKQHITGPAMWGAVPSLAERELWACQQ